MLFNSIVFLLFFLVAYQVFWLLRGAARRYWLLATSLFFYGWWDWRFLIHFVAITVISYGVARLLSRRKSRGVLWIGIGLNLANLVFFKYTNSVLLILANDLGVSQALVVKEKLSLILPLAISFYTFQITAFLVDVYRGEVEDVGLVDFLVFILFFPQLIAGPIMRHHDFLNQLNNPRLDERSLPDGLFLIMMGLAKKVLVADGIASIIDPVWAKPAMYGGPVTTLATVGFTLQVFCDFSGYTDMARGMARLLGYEIPENFFAPYLAGSFADLWKRWHVTLSTWLRDYLYIPLGGSRVSSARLNVNIMIVMCLGGLWHGNNYTFFLWGFLHGVLLVVEKTLGLERPSQRPVVHILRVIVVYFWFVVGGVFFRARDLSSVTEVFRSLGRLGPTELTELPTLIQLICAGWAFMLLQKYQTAVLAFLARTQRLMLPGTALVLFFLLVRIERASGEFIYFQF